MSIKTIIVLSMLLPSMLLSSGCVLSSKDDPGETDVSIDQNDHTLAVIFGYFDMKDAPSWGGIDWVSVKQYKPGEGYYFPSVKDGVFWHIGVSNGALRINKFGRNSRWYSYAPYTYNFGDKGKNETSVIIENPGVYYLGSYKYIPIKAHSFLQPESFRMVKIESPSEKQLLVKILKHLQEDIEFSRYSHQIGMIKKRLKQLN